MRPVVVVLMGYEPALEMVEQRFMLKLFAHGYIVHDMCGANWYLSLDKQKPRTGRGFWVYLD